MGYEDYELPTKKFRTCHRDDMYHVIKENDATGLFGNVTDTFLMAFAIGFHIGKREAVEGNAINHTNMPYISREHQHLIIILMLDRHPNLEDGSALWSMVEDYAEFGIKVLYESLRKSEWILDVTDILQSE